MKGADPGGSKGSQTFFIRIGRLIQFGIDAEDVSADGIVSSKANYNRARDLCRKPGWQG